jgi:hypothetical protein
MVALWHLTRLGEDLPDRPAGVAAGLDDAGTCLWTVNAGSIHCVRDDAGMTPMTMTVMTLDTPAESAHDERWHCRSAPHPVRRTASAEW